MSESFDESPRPAKKVKPARDKIKDLLASRNHSELEIRHKMAASYSEAEIEDALTLARERKWLASDEEVARQIIETLTRKNKGRQFINEYLEARGLPAQASNESSEVEKGRALVASRLAAKLPKGKPLDYEDEMTIFRLLGNRGFEEDSIRAVIESLKHEQE